MKLNTLMPARIKEYFLVELAAYKQCRVKGEYEQAWAFLERAHILGQSYPIEHTQIHWLMLKDGFRRKNLKEVLGQALRLMTGGLKSFVNRVPTGNTGGSNVPPLKRMEIPEDLKKILSS
jgi:hypothetical protein